ncbi:shikimate kinase [Frondihabitans australicus]|uniref:Shikimate kinase n=1 Tax=Frondihabitans australicus TaxID=386892 RepID=A0A495IDL2_9MICO|nr:shikimate kinase [Frondihabitans australicus]RKR74093.1 shikimate kinase [Frondihabitans australicus]
MPGPDRPIVVIGPMGAGKTSVGKKLAKRLGRTFVDTDRVIVRHHGPIAALFEEHGEERFREIERDAVADALLDPASVISLGGGAVLHPETRERLRGARVVLLAVTPEAVAARIQGTDRPLLQHDGLTAWQEIAERRAPVYASLADFTVDTSHRPLVHVVDDIVRWIETEHA